MARYNKIITIDDDGTASNDPAHYTWHDATTGSEVEPEVIVNWTAIEDDPDAFVDLFDGVDMGKFGNFPSIERRLESLRPDREYQVTVVFTVTAKNEDAAREAVEDVLPYAYDPIDSVDIDSVYEA